jgi:hydroxymethylglutaryl-CoA lyase
MSSAFPAKTFRVHDVGMRDGLQMEKQVVPTETKLAWFRQLAEAGVKIIQVGSFVHPDKVPTMADTDRLFQQLTSSGVKPSDVTLSGLVLNEKGLERGMACGVELFCMGVSASETHSKKNTGMGVGEATERIIKMAEAARAAGKKVQLSVQSAFGCGFEGPIDEDHVIRLVTRYVEAGFRQISLADTAGHATPASVSRLFSRARDLAPDAELACHIHNTYGMGLANCLAAMQSGCAIIETAVGGLGGCPFTKVAGGNVATEDFVHMLERSGFATGISVDLLASLAREMAQFFGRELPGVVYKVGQIPTTKG